MNAKAIVVGHLGRDAELRFSPSGVPILNTSIASNQRRKVRGEVIEETQWFNVTVLGNRAESLVKYLKKGTLLYVDGELRIRMYEDRSGNPRVDASILADTVQFMNSKRQDPKPEAERSETEGESEEQVQDESYDDVDVPW